MVAASVFVFVVMINVDAVIFASFMTLVLLPFQAQAEMTSQISFSRLKLSNPRAQGKQNSSLMRLQECLSLTFIIFNQFFIICTNLMLLSFVFSLSFNAVNAATALLLIYRWDAVSLQLLWVNGSVSTLGHAYC